ncbi:MAG: hypothetical protein KDE27_12780 [Planctomycetes bacterium]|nr:hypothetical protein [Planctomycetota bacterium]
MVANNRRWLSAGPGPHWCEIRLPASYTLGSAHVFVGTDDINTVANFSLQQWNGTAWVDIPGAVVTGNTLNQHRLQFTAPITVDRVRFHTPDGIARVREIALFAPNQGQGQPWATGYTLNLAKNRRAVSSSNSGGSTAGTRAVDGYAHDSSTWVTGNQNGPYTIDLELYDNSKVGNVHLHTDASTQWALRPGPGNGVYIDSLSDGRRLASDGTAITMVAPSTTDTSVQWVVTPVVADLYYLEHPASGKRLLRNPSGGLAMQPGWTQPTGLWRFIHAYDAAPASSYGIGCGPATIEVVGTPAGGESFTVRTAGTISGAPAVTVVSWQRALTPAAAIGLPNCWLNIDMNLIVGNVPGSADAQGRYDVSMQLPPGFLGSLYAQTAYLHPFINPAWVATTPGAAIHVR